MVPPLSFLFHLARSAFRAAGAFFCAFLCLLWFPLLSPATTTATPPNIVLVMADDMGYSDLGCYGGEIETPTLDQLASNGIRFTNYYVNNMCLPTRASLLTSLYPRTAMRGNSADQGLAPDTILLPEALKTVGYKSYMAGKWHLSDPKKPNGASAPHQRGFDKSYSTYWGTSDFFAPADLNLNGQNKEHEWRDNPHYYYTDAITDYSLKFLKEHAADPASSTRPFFLYVAYNAAHWPLHAKPADIDHYKGRYSMGWDQLRRDRHHRMKELGVVNPDWELSPRNPNVPAWEEEEHKAWQQRRMEVYAAQITCMDRNIGRIVQYLKNTGALENTLFIYQHDNGGCHVEYPPQRTGSWTKPFTTDGKNTPVVPGNLPHVMPGPQSTWQSYGHGWANVSNTPFRLFKQHDHEGGTRSPLIMSWPQGLPQSMWGNLSHPLVHVMDLMPTLLEIAGADPQAPDGKIPFQGRSFLPLLRGQPENWQPHRELFWAHNKGKAARIDDWKLVSENNKPWELYHLPEDGTELRDLSNTMPQKVAELKGAWQRQSGIGN